MASDVVMPKMGYDMEEGTILRWIKSEGDEVVTRGNERLRPGQDIAPQSGSGG